jgi:hypothetical protein
MKGFIYLTKEYNSDGQELKHNGLTKIGIGKSVDAERRFYEHHNKGSKSTTNMEFISDFECENMDYVESELHNKLKSLGFEVVKRKSQFGDIEIESRTEVFSGKHIDTGEELSEKLIYKILNSVVSGEEFIKITRNDFNPHFLQELAIRQILDSIDNEEESDVNIIAELCARFGKTLTYLELFKRLDNDVMIIPSYIHSVFTSFENEILGKYKDEQIGKWSNFVNFKVIDTREGDKWIEKYNENLGKSKLVVFVSIQTPEDSFSKFDIIKETDSNRKFILIDEADFGAHTENSQKVIDYIYDGEGIKIVTSGTGIERASKSLMNKKISDVISVSYTEMLLSKSGNSKYFNDEYLRDLDPVRNRRVIEYLTSVDKSLAMKSLLYAPGINFFKLVLPKSHRDMIHSLIDDEDLTAWSKILSDVNKNQAIIKSIINGLWGIAGIKDSALNTLAISSAIGRDPKVVQFFVGTPTNKELTKLANLFQSCHPNYIIRVLSGAEDATNATSEKLVKQDIQDSKDQGKDGVIILSKDMGSRSFSVSETDAVVLMYDNGSVSSLVQKISRALTGGDDYFGNEKKEGNIISLSLDPNRVDAVDIYVVEEAQKNKTSFESFSSAVKRIRKSVNIFVIDDNGDKHSLLEKDEYYSELIEKFSFERLKNSQINITPLISDEELRNSLLDIKSSELSKNEKKVKQLKGKGKKFVDSGKSEKDKEDKEETEFDKVDINVLRQAILTINNSILSIIAIDDSIEDKSKSFRNVLQSIDGDLEKCKEFYELFNIRPSVVVKLMDKEVINEQIIDICISKF